MRLLCIMIGYVCGCFLTADIVARHKTGKSVCEIGSKNPGTVNIGRMFGRKWALITLLGDVLKTILPCMLCGYVLFPSLGHLAILYTGLGAALGHGFPFWNKFHGGRSVAVTCIYIILATPLWGIIVELIGLCLVIATGYLAVGALAIPLLYLIPVFHIYGLEAGLVVLAGAALMFFLHRDSLWRMAHKEERRVNLLGKLKKQSL